MAQLKKLVTTLILLMCISTVGGCVNGSQISNPPSTTTPPMTTQFYAGYFTVSDEPILNKTVDLSFNLETIDNAPGTTIHFYLPPAVQLVNGNSTWTGDIGKGEKIVKTISVVVKEEGDWRINVGVENSQYKGLNRFFYCYLNSYKTTGSLRDKPTILPEPPTPATKIQ